MSFKAMVDLLWRRHCRLGFAISSADYCKLRSSAGRDVLDLPQFNCAPLIQIQNLRKRGAAQVASLVARPSAIPEKVSLKSFGSGMNAASVKARQCHSDCRVATTKPVRAGAPRLVCY
jgi:hypothetical protein